MLEEALIARELRDVPVVILDTSLQSASDLLETLRAELEIVHTEPLPLTARELDIEIPTYVVPPVDTPKRKSKRRGKR